jgi:hypothetical protein
MALMVVLQGMSRTQQPQFRYIVVLHFTAHRNRTCTPTTLDDTLLVPDTSGLLGLVPQAAGAQLSLNRDEAVGRPQARGEEVWVRAPHGSPHGYL